MHDDTERPSGACSAEQEDYFESFAVTATEMSLLVEMVGGPFMAEYQSTISHYINIIRKLPENVLTRGSLKRISAAYPATARRRQNFHCWRHRTG